MPSLSANRLAYLAAQDYTDCYCVRIVRRDGVILRFTSFARDLVISESWDGSTQSVITPVTYRANTGYQMTAIAQSASLAVDNIDIQGIYESSGISKSDLLAGVYDSAEVYIFLTNYERPVEDEHPIKKAVYGITKPQDDSFHIEFRGLTQLLNQKVGRKITTLSSKDLAEEGVPLTADTWQASTAYSSVKGDYDWRPNGVTANVVKPTVPNGYWYYLSVAGTSGGSEPAWPTSGTVLDGTCEWTAIPAYSVDGTITSFAGSGQFGSTDLTSFADGWFADGVVTFNTGNNAGKAVEVRQFVGASGTCVLFFDAPLPIQIGDTFTVTVGYNRTLIQCRDKFANSENFGGFPYLPGPRTAARIGLQ